MTAAGRGPAPINMRTARIMYVALFLGFLVMSGGLVGFHALTSGFGVAAGDLSLFGLRAVALVLVLVGTVAVRLVRNTLPERRAGGTFETWWAAGGARAPIVWGAAEGVGVLGAMLYVFTGDTLTLALPFVWSVAVFVMHPPSRLLGG